MTTKLVIVGGVAGGATAAARARRLDEFAEIIVFERGGIKVDASMRTTDPDIFAVGVNAAA
jgi:pyruvate/2-oxoglutarate dehydrogenase complex dihydrolipoamide dehydrogenase (E3) component